MRLPGKVAFKMVDSPGMSQSKTSYLQNHNTKQMLSKSVQRCVQGLTKATYVWLVNSRSVPSDVQACLEESGALATIASNPEAFRFVILRCIDNRLGEWGPCHHCQQPRGPLLRHSQESGALATTASNPEAFCLESGALATIASNPEAFCFESGALATIASNPEAFRFVILRCIDNPQGGWPFPRSLKNVKRADKIEKNLRKQAGKDKMDHLADMLRCALEGSRVSNADVAGSSSDAAAASEYIDKKLAALNASISYGRLMQFIMVDAVGNNMSELPKAVNEEEKKLKEALKERLSVSNAIDKITAPLKTNESEESHILVLLARLVQEAAPLALVLAGRGCPETLRTSLKKICNAIEERFNLIKSSGNEDKTSLCTASLARITQLGRFNLIKSSGNEDKTSLGTASLARITKYLEDLFQKRRLEYPNGEWLENHGKALYPEYVKPGNKQTYKDLCLHRPTDSKIPNFTIGHVTRAIPKPSQTGAAVEVYYSALGTLLGHEAQRLLEQEAARSIQSCIRELQEALTVSHCHKDTLLLCTFLKSAWHILQIAQTFLPIVGVVLPQRYAAAVHIPEDRIARRLSLSSLSRCQGDTLLLCTFLKTALHAELKRCYGVILQEKAKVLKINLDSMIGASTNKAKGVINRIDHLKKLAPKWAEGVQQDSQSRRRAAIGSVQAPLVKARDAILKKGVETLKVLDCGKLRSSRAAQGLLALTFDVSYIVSLLHHKGCKPMQQWFAGWAEVPREEFLDSDEMKGIMANSSLNEDDLAARPSHPQHEAFDPTPFSQAEPLPKLSRVFIRISERTRPRTPHPVHAGYVVGSDAPRLAPGQRPAFLLPFQIDRIEHHRPRRSCTNNLDLRATLERDIGMVVGIGELPTLVTVRQAGCVRSGHVLARTRTYPHVPHKDRMWLSSAR
eukprot:gene22172-29235_t